MINAITFDFWNTLFETVRPGELRLRLIKRASERAGYGGISDTCVELAIDRAWSEWDRVWEHEYRTFGAQEWVSFALADLGVSLQVSDREALVRAIAYSGVEANPPLVDGLAVLLPQLAARYRLGLICDTGLSPGWMLRELMATHDILRYFGQFTFSDELGVSKPHPEAFLTTLKRLGVSPGNAVHVGDYPRTDIAGARAVGMKAIRFIGVRDWGEGSVPADAVISSYAELKPVLEAWCA